ncbi:MAG: creatininase family protein [Nannocystaceae bacterium]|nr:creatininase family protein [Nannocystaceae bacterium]
MSAGFDGALVEQTWPTVARLLQGGRRTVAIVPVGSVEAHGPHLPLGTDTLISVEVARRAGRALAEQGYVCLRFPAINYGVTDWAAMFTGTVSLGADTTAAVVFETCRAAAAMGFARVVVTNAHLEPAHIATLRAVAERFADELGTPLLFVDKTRRRNAERLGDEFKSGSCHAGQYESSLVLAIAPALVDLPRARQLPPHIVPLHERIAAGARDFADCGLDQAYCGTPAGATATEGEATLGVLTDMVVTAVRASFDDPPR